MRADRFIVPRSLPEDEQWLAEFRLVSDMVGFTRWACEVSREIGAGAHVRFLYWCWSQGYLYLEVSLGEGQEYWTRRYRVLERRIEKMLVNVHVHHIADFQRLAQDLFATEMKWTFGSCGECGDGNGWPVLVKKGLCKECDERNQAVSFPKNPKGSYVYFVVEGDLVKIGSSTEPKKRVQSLQIGNPRPLVLVGLLPGTAEREHELHRKFKPHHVRGEWFVKEPILEWLKGQQSEGSS